MNVICQEKFQKLNSAFKVANQQLMLVGSTVMLGAHSVILCVLGRMHGTRTTVLTLNLTILILLILE